MSANGYLSSRDLHWCKCRLPAPLLGMLHKHEDALVVAGGFVRSCVSGERISDVDIFSRSKDYAKAVATDLAAAAGQGRKLIETDNAFTVYGLSLPIQFIHRWTYTNPEDVIASFDFTICQAALWVKDKHWHSMVGPEFYRDLAGKRLIYACPKRNEDAGGSMLRVLKFYQREYRIPLDSLGAVIARLLRGVKLGQFPGFASSWGTEEWEGQMEKVITGLLREVDPNVDPEHRAHLPTLAEAEQETKEEAQP